MLKTFSFGEFGIVITDNTESTSVLFEPDIDSVIKDNKHDRCLFKNAFDSLVLQYPAIKEVSHSLGPKLNKEIITDLDWFLDYLDDGYQSDYSFNLSEEGWKIKDEK
jgi:hypothetical protein